VHDVAIVGATGYLGGELVRLITEHPEMHLAAAVSSSAAGKPLSEVVPYLGEGTDLILQADSGSVDAELVFLALPAGESMKLVPDLRARGIKVVDLGPDYRLKDAKVFASTYGRTHSDPEGLAQAVYGLPEIAREEIRSAELVANPGCYPTSALLALVPLAKDHLLPGQVVIDAKSGSSGAGAQPSPSTHHPVAGASVNPYGGGHHRHLPEIQQVLSAYGELPGLTFSPHLVPLVRGLLSSIYAPGIAPEAFDAWAPAFQRFYSGQPFVRLGPVPRLPWAVGSNLCLISVEASPPSGVVYSAIDNLVKGGAGQAVQNGNLMLGLPETTGLTRGGLGP
jgi:N-acetyl-gamma-glutamyl-phosphate reductase